jgi:predicted permease
VAPLLGRSLEAADELPMQRPAALLGHALWVTRFSADPAVIGRSLDIGRQQFRIVGVMPPGFDFPRGSNFWTPVRAGEDRADFGFLTAVVRLGSGATSAAADNEAFRALEPTIGHGSRLRAVHFTPLRETLRPQEGLSLILLLVCSTLVFLVAWVHVAGMQLSRTVQRAHEFSVRSALGARRGHLVRLCASEALLLGGLAVVIAAALLPATIDALLVLLPESMSAGQALGADWRTLLFGAGVSLVGITVLWVVPALSLSTIPAGSLVAADDRSSNTRLTVRLRGALICVQLMLSVTLSYTAFSLVHQFAVLSSLDLGFDTNGLTALSFAPAGEGQDAQARHAVEMAQLIEAVESMPDVEGVAAANTHPLDGSTFLVQTRMPPSAETDTVSMHWITPRFFATVGQHLSSGREFGVEDHERSGPVAIVNQAFARRFGVGAPGATIEVFGLPREIVGIVGNAVDGGPTRKIAPQVYIPANQFSPATTLLVRSHLPLGRVEQLVSRAASQIAGSLGSPTSDSMETLVSSTLAVDRARSTLLSLLAIVALGLTSIGIFAAVRAAIDGRRKELGVRLALGATPTRIRVMLARDVALLAVGGISLGLLGGISVARLFSSVLFAVPGVDVLALAAGALGSAAAAAVATHAGIGRTLVVDVIGALRAQ